MAPWLLLVFLSGSTLDERADFQRGQTLYEELEFEAALVAFEAAAAAPDLTPEETARVLVWVSICAASTGDMNGARSAVEQAYDADPDVAMPETAPPKLREFFDQVRSQHVASAPQVEASSPAAPDESEPEPDQGESAAPLPGVLLAGIGTVAIGGVLIAAAAVASGFAFADYGQATDPDAVQLEALAAQDRFNGEALVATTAGVLGLATSAAGVGVVFWDLARE